MSASRIVPQPNDEDRLVWAPLAFTPDQGVQFWWPAIYFEDYDEFERHNAGNAINKEFRHDLILAMYQKLAHCRPVQFLGRPLTDVQGLAEHEMCSYLKGLGRFLDSVIFHPSYFVEQLSEHLSIEEIEGIYQDFHRGIQETHKYLQRTPGRDFARDSEIAWLKYMQQGDGQQLALTQAAPAAAVPARRASSPPTGRAWAPVRHRPAPAGLQSPNQSIAAVSVTEESTTTPHSLSRRGGRAQNASATPSLASAKSHIPVYQKDWKRPEQPLGMSSWQQVQLYLTMCGWTRSFDEETDELYFQRTFRPEDRFSVRDMKLMAQHHLGWKPQNGEGAEEMVSGFSQNQNSFFTTPATRRPKRRGARDCPASNAKDYSFGFMWKHHAEPEGWTRVEPPRGHPSRQIADYIYLRPHVTLESLSNYRLGEDYFDDHWKVLEWWQENHCRPGHGSDAATESTNHSVASESDKTAEHPSSYLEDDDDSEDEIEEPDPPSLVRSRKRAATATKSSKKATKPKKRKTRPSRRNWMFGMLWANHLQPKGWTMPRAKGNRLVDYHYVRPGCSVKNGILGVDYFASVEDVLRYCQEHQDYPESSTCGTPTDNEGGMTTDAMSTLASEDESTKHPAESEDEVDDDDEAAGSQHHHSDASYSTPGTRTQPQDPGKPLLRDESETEELDDEQKYLWKNLWPFLKNLGWTYTRAKDGLGDWWYLPPRNLNKELTRNTEQCWQEGEDYFENEDNVIEYCRRMDELDKQDAKKKSNARKDGEAMEVGTEETENIEDDDSLEKPDAGVGAHKKPRSQQLTGSRQKKQQSKKSTKQTSKQTPRRQSNSKQKATPKIVSWKSINVDVEDVATNKAPWVQNPVPRTGLHSMLTRAMGCQYRSCRYYLPGETDEHSSKGFTDISEVLRYICVQRRGKFQVLPETTKQDQDSLHRLVARALVQGFHHDQDRTRALTYKEVLVCLKQLFRFDFVNDKWIPPEELKYEPGASPDSLPPGKLHASYDSLASLLIDLRGVENLEGEKKGRRRKPLIGQAKKEEDQKTRLLMAFRLTISEDSCIKALEIGVESSDSHSIQSKASTKKRANERADESMCTTRKMPKLSKNKSTASSNDQSCDVFDFDKHCNEKSRKSKTDSAKKKQLKEEAMTMSVKYEGSLPNPAIWAEARKNDLWKIGQKIGIHFSGSVYSIPDEFWPWKQTFLSVDEALKFIGTYGGYSLKVLDGEDKDVFKWRIASCNVPGRSSEWRNYRLLSDKEGIQVLEVLGFKKDDACGKWTVPEALMKVENIHLGGNQPLLKKEYSSLDELRIALRSVPELDAKVDDSRPQRRRKQDCIFNEHQMTAFRLWLAVGPPGPDEVLHFKAHGQPTPSSATVEEKKTGNTQDEIENNGGILPRAAVETINLPSISSEKEATTTESKTIGAAFQPSGTDCHEGSRSDDATGSEGGVNESSLHENCFQTHFLLTQPENDSADVPCGHPKQGNASSEEEGSGSGENVDKSNPRENGFDGDRSQSLSTQPDNDATDTPSLHPQQEYSTGSVENVDKSNFQENDIDGAVSQPLLTQPGDDSADTPGGHSCQSNEDEKDEFVHKEEAHRPIGQIDSRNSHEHGDTMAFDKDSQSLNADVSTPSFLDRVQNSLLRDTPEDTNEYVGRQSWYGTDQPFTQRFDF